MCMMQTIFRDMIRQRKCAIYMDNLIFKGKTKEELRKNTLEGLEILAKHDLYIKESKCYWEVEEVPVLGHIERMFRSSMDFATSTADMYEDIPKLLDPSHS